MIADALERYRVRNEAFDASAETNQLGRAVARSALARATRLQREQVHPSAIRVDYALHVAATSELLRGATRTTTDADGIALRGATRTTTDADGVALRGATRTTTDAWASHCAARE